MIGDVLLESDARRRRPGGRSPASRTTRAGRCSTRAREPLGRVVAGYGNDGASGFEGCVVGRAIGTYLHGPLLPRNPWLADTMLSWAIAHATGADPEPLAPLADELEHAAHAVAAERARSAAGGPPEPLLGPARAEVDARVAGLPALRNRCDRRMQHDAVELVETEEPVAAHGLVVETTPLERAVQLAGEDDVDDVLRPEAPLGRDRLDDRDGPFERELVALAARVPSPRAARAGAPRRASRRPRTPPPGSSQCSRPRFSWRIRAGSSRASGAAPTPGSAARAACSASPTSPVRARRARSREARRPRRARLAAARRDELRDPHPGLDDERSRAIGVEEDHLELAAVARVDQARAR